MASRLGRLPRLSPSAGRGHTGATVDDGAGFYMAMDGLSERLASDLHRHFPELVEAMQHRVYGGVRRLVPAAADAEDVAAETFLRAFRALQRMEPARVAELRVEGWVWTIALNLCRNAARSRARRPTVRLDPAWAPADEAVSPETAVVGDARVAQLLEGLPPAQRVAVVLHHIAGLPYADMAEATGRPEGTLRADVHRGLERLRRSLVEEVAV